MNLGTSLRMHVNAVLSIFHVSIFKTIKIVQNLHLFSYKYSLFKFMQSNR